MSPPPAIETNDSFTVILEGKPYTTHVTNPLYDKIITAFKTGRYGEMAELLDVKQTIKTYIGQVGDITIDADLGVLYYKGTAIHNSLTARILTMISEGFDAMPLVNFLSNLRQNPSKKAVDELYEFLDYGKMPITSDGFFIAYKRVNDDFTSCHDGVTDNSIGKIVSMERNEVDDRSHVTCSHGLHICSFEYLSHFSGDKVILVKVNPADVVSIPVDYNNTKARVCKYEVLSDMTLQEAGLPEHEISTSVYDGYWDEEDDGYDSEEEEDDGYDSEEDLAEAEAEQAVEEAEDWEEESLTEDLADEPVGWTTVDEMTSDELVEYEAALNSTDLIETTQSIEAVESSYFQLGFSFGYDDGRALLSKSVTGILARDLIDSSTRDQLNELDEGYQVGYKAGKSHKKQLYPRVYMA
jgi:hypothetical protein